MHLITRADDELYGVASAAGKLGWAPKLLARLADARRAAPADPGAAARYAFALMAALPSLGVEFEAHARFTDTIDALGQALRLDPDNWLARYSRARLRALIPSSYGAYSVQASGELSLAQADLELLLARQGGLPAQAYFVSTHALAAVVDHLAGTPPADGRPPLLDVLAACPRTPVGLPALGAVLCEPLATMHAGAVGPERQAIGEVMAVLYGEQPAVVAALSRQSVW
ncbi:hypothetical protein CS0771_55530 [Catellatospora sp. IY07-71]|uniref:hypothetical protein n=1 Tax=Catellatospora sp. IY07-71 TaxID=2728827 RepID=UPI001BB3F68C|nr:hypothetical protein [Catellatospora sp. IY07-71]BCJ76009.1 hypothetical protein CS0771_55530 [Catellatospora sp. IY07-71]